MAVTTKKTFPNAVGANGQSSTVFTPVEVQLNNQDDLDVYVTLSGGTRVLQLRQSTGSTAVGSGVNKHPQVNDTTGLYFPAVTAGTTLYNYTLSTDNNTITFSTALPSGAVVSIERRTRDADSNYTTFASGSTIRATDLNNSATESNFTAQDARNKAFDLEGKLFGGPADGTIKTKLDGIEDNATADQTASEIRDLIATSPLGSNHITTDAVYTNAIQDNAVTADKLADSINSEIAANTAKTTNQTHTGDVTGSVALTIATDAVTTAKILDNNVNDDKLSHTGVTSGTYGGSTAIPTIVVNEQGRVTSAAENSVSFDVVADTSPQLGGNLDVQDKEIRTDNTNQSIILRSNGTGTVAFLGTGSQSGTLEIKTETNAKAIKIQAPTNSNLTGSYQLTLPVNNGDAGQFLKTDGSGVLSWDTVSGGGGGGGSATGAPNNIVTLTESIDGSRTDFTMSETPSSAQNLLVSVNGVIQKPNAGTTIASSAEGFCVSGSTLKFATAPASGSSLFIVEQSAVAAGSSSDKITEGNSEVEIFDDNATSRAVITLDGNEKFRVNEDGQIGLGGANYGNDGQVLTSQGPGAAAQWEAIPTVNTDLINDTSPQLGGDLDVQASKITTSTSNGNVKLEPNGNGLVEIRGAGGYDGTLTLNCSQNSHGIKLKSPPHSEAASYTLTFPDNLAVQSPTGGVRALGLVSVPSNTSTGTGELGFGTVDSVQISSISTASSFPIVFSNATNALASSSTSNSITITPNTSLNLNDDIKAKFGAGDDLQIYHDSNNNHSYISETGTGNIYIVTNGAEISLLGDGGNDFLLRGINNGAVELYYQGSSGAGKKFETTSAGATLTGSLTGTGHVYLPDGGKFVSGDDNDLQIYHNNSNGIIDNDKGVLYLQAASGVSVMVNNTEDAIYCAPNGAVTLYNDGTPRFATSAGGATVTGTLTTTSGINAGNNISLGDSIKLKLGVGDDLQIYHDGSDSYLYQAGDGELKINNQGDSTGCTILSNASASSYIRFQHTGHANSYLGFENDNFVLYTKDAGSASHSVRANINASGLAFRSDTADANRINDYEEGTFVPQVTQGISSISYSSQQGNYVKVGNFIHVTFRVTFSGTGNSTHFKIGNFPVNSQNSNSYTSGGLISYSSVDFNNTSTAHKLWMGNNQSEAELYHNNTTATTCGSSQNSVHIWGFINYSTA